MDSIRIAKVERVQYSKAGLRSEGTLHLTAHHLIFKNELGRGEQEVWIPYPMITTVTRLPLSLYGQSPLAFGTRTFEYFTFVFTKGRDAIEVFESVKELTVASSVTSLYAYFYQPNPPFDITDGWSIYNPRQEFTRMGVGTRTKAWRLTDINKDYRFCPTYPAFLVVPTKISDTVLSYGGRYRSKARIPTLVYLHWNNHASITRSSQPTVGLTNNRSVQDEKLIEAIFQSHHVAASPFANVPQRSAIYGAMATNLIIDARSGTSGVANVVRGGGTENMDYYKDGKKVYLGVENIHVMRDSLAKVVDVLREADVPVPIPGTVERGDEMSFGTLDRQGLRRSGWLKHISALLDGAAIVIKNVHINSSHVLIHCSDGWDRTAQLSSLSQLCLDPYYRTYCGFQVLIEKDWVSFGHRFLDRCGHLSSEKFFLTPSNDGDRPQAFLASVQNKFVSPSHLKETSPVFHQFLECVRQIQRQHPKRFEFNERLLERLHYHVYSCQFGTFLFNNERDRRLPANGATEPATVSTPSLWDYLNSESEKKLLLNPNYDSSLDTRDSRSSDMGVLVPDPKDVRFWHELYGRTDEEMNGRIIDGQDVGADIVGPVDGAVDDPVINLISSFSNVDVYDDIAPPSSPLQQSSSLSPMPRTPSPHSHGNTNVPSSARSQRTSAARQILVEPAPSSPPAPPSPIPRTPSRKQQTGAFGLSTGGVKSMWTQFSSNASAAFSAMQEAYDGAAKELLGGGGGSPGTSPSGWRAQSEEFPETMTIRDSLSHPDIDDSPSTPSSRLAPYVSRQARGSNRASSSQNPLTLDFEDPWSTSNISPHVQDMRPKRSTTDKRLDQELMSTSLSSSQINDESLEISALPSPNPAPLRNASPWQVSPVVTHSTFSSRTSPAPDIISSFEGSSPNPQTKYKQIPRAKEMSEGDSTSDAPQVNDTQFDPLGVGLLG